MKNFIGSNLMATLIMTLCFTGSVDVREQSPQSVSCPTISARCAADDCGCGPHYEFVAIVRGGDPNVRPTYNWTISVGKIEHGQGTSSIKVNANETKTDSITASVEILGYDSACANKASVSKICCDFPPPPNKALQLTAR